MEASIELLKQTIELIWLNAGFKYCDSNGEPITIRQEDAIVAGNLVRLIK